MIHQNLPHRRRSDSEEVAAVFEFLRLGANKLDKRFVDESRGVECVIRLPAARIRTSKSAKLVIDNFHELGGAGAGRFVGAAAVVAAGGFFEEAVVEAKAGGADEAAAGAA